MFIISIAKTASLLQEMDVPFTIKKIWDGYQLRFGWCEGDVACHSGTYGSLEGFVETYCFPWDEDDVSMLTPEEAAAKISAYYYDKNRGL